mmetsp:Transcript_10401/g.12184  ORF Transcript_10401/g.12184 Transcript_10401/m.12184 type:complete len:323 (+) Transcript_10401:61-1029(+)
MASNDAKPKDLSLQPLQLEHVNSARRSSNGGVATPHQPWSPRNQTLSSEAAAQPAVQEPEEVITQFTANAPGSPRAQRQGSQYKDQRTPRRSWTSILCCVRPQEDGYTLNAAGHPSLAETVSSPVPPPFHGKPCLGPKLPKHAKKKTLVLDLDETLVHSSFKPVPNADYIIPVEIDNKVTDVYVLKRPGVDAFMNAMGDHYEVVVFTASLAKYADPLLDLLDQRGNITFRLFRDSCCPYEGNYVKDLSRIGRELCDTIIIDNSPHSYIFQPENAIPIGTYVGDNSDRDLPDLTPFLLGVKEHEDVRDVLRTRLPRSNRTMYY